MTKKNAEQKLLADINAAMAPEVKSVYNILISFYDRKAVEFKDIAGYQLNGDWVAVSMHDGTTHVYSASDVCYVQHYIAEGV